MKGTASPSRRTGPEGAHFANEQVDRGGVRKRQAGWSSGG